MCKLLWSVIHKKDRMWIQWIHGYYIKGKDVYDMEPPQQSSWIIRKIFGAKEYFSKLQDGREWVQQPQFSTRKLYKAFMGEHVRQP